MIKIDKGIAVLEKKKSPGAPTKYPFKTMDIGDSFFVPLNGSTAAQKSNSLLGSARSALGKKSVSTRPVTESGVDGVRVWRIA